MRTIFLLPMIFLTACVSQPGAVLTEPRNDGLRADPNYIPGMGTLPVGYGSYNATTPAAGQTLSHSSTQQQSAIAAMGGFQSAAKRSAQIRGIAYRVAYVTSGGRKFAILQPQTAGKTASDDALYAFAQASLKCGLSGGLWAGEGAYAGLVAAPLNC